MQLGFWNRPRDAARSIEIDLVAVDEANKRVRFGSCKRSADAHTNKSLEDFERHVEGFLAARDHRQLQGWTKEKVLFSPSFTPGDRAHFTRKGYQAKDLHDYAALF